MKLTLRDSIGNSAVFDFPPQDLAPLLRAVKEHMPVRKPLVLSSVGENVIDVNNVFATMGDFPKNNTVENDEN